METITYPRREAVYDDVMGQQTLDRLTAMMMSWRQGAGSFGGLWLHSCWSISGVLTNRYHGQTCYIYASLIRGATMLYDRTGNVFWKRLADDMASNVLFLQCADGGFRHASNEYEPTYLSSQTCPISQFQPILGLLDYAGWQHADPTLKTLVKDGIDRHWTWFQARWWRCGNGMERPLTRDGWCGVTNQDFTVIAALASYGKVYGDFSRYEEFGKPTLDAYLTPKMYHEALGLFERGDCPNFAERTPYNGVILPMLDRIDTDAGDARIQGVIDNIVLHLFDAEYTAPNGQTHLAWGAQTDPEDKSRVTGWIRTPGVIQAYPVLFPFMERTLARLPQPAPEKEDVLARLKQMAASYVLRDGSLLSSIWPKDPVLAAVTTTGAGGVEFWLWLIEHLGDKVLDPLREPLQPFTLHRQLDGCVWKTGGDLWAIEKDGQRVFGGYRPVTHGVTHGDESAPAERDYAELDVPDVVEIFEG